MVVKLQEAKYFSNDTEESLNQSYSKPIDIIWRHLETVMSIRFNCGAEANLRRNPSAKQMSL